MEKYNHLWIPNEEVIEIEYKPTARNIDVPVDFSEHGIKLLGQLDTIKKIHNKKKSPVSSEYIIFKTRLYNNQKFSNNERVKFINNNGLEIKLVKSDNEAIVATKIDKFNMLYKKVENYQERNRNLGFQYIDDFEFINRTEKQSNSIRKIITDSLVDYLDIQIQLMPSFGDIIYEKSIEYIFNIIKNSSGEILEDIYNLSDGTPIIRAKVEPSVIDILTEDDIVFKVEKTNFFDVDKQDKYEFNLNDVNLSNEIFIEDLPVVGILDTGVDFGSSILKDFVIDEWIADDITTFNPYHGTGCAIRAMFGNDLANQIEANSLTPKVRIVSGIISNGKEPVPFSKFIDRIRKAIKELKKYTKIFNLSFNSDEPIDGDYISTVAYELDTIMRSEGVQIIISSGNHKLYRVYSDLNDILDDEDSRISSPADSILGITVGSYVTKDNPYSVSQEYDIAPYSRVGFGLGGMQKPDLVAPGGNIYYNASLNEDVVICEDCALIPGSDGNLNYDCGTSFAAPVLAGDYAVLTNQLPIHIQDRELLGKALMYHNAKHLFDITSMDFDEREAVRKVYGNGVLDLDSAMYSNPYKVTFVRLGELNYLTKQRVKFYMPTNMANQEGIRTCKVSVTCMSEVPFDKNKGLNYVSAYIGASLKKIDTKQQLNVGNPKKSEGRDQWSHYQNFSNIFSSFNPGDWQIWLQLRKRWDISKDYNMKYALVVTIEDLTRTNDIYSAIKAETGNRFRDINEVRIRI